MSVDILTREPLHHINLMVIDQMYTFDNLHHLLTDSYQSHDLPKNF